MNGYADLGFEPTGLDVLDRRRYNVSRPDPAEGYNPFSVSRPAAPQPARPPAAPAAPAAAPAGGQVNTFGGAGTYSSSGDALLDHIRNVAMADASARSRGARASAMHSSPNDPSLAAYAGLEGLLGGQGDAASSLNRGALGRLSEIDRRKWEEYILRLRHEWEQEAQRQAAQAAMYGSIGSIGGAALGAYL